MKKPTICTCQTEGADQLRSKLISDFVFATQIVQFLYFLNPKRYTDSTIPLLSKSKISSLLYSSVGVGPVQKQHCWFSHNVAHFIEVFVFVPYCFDDVLNKYAADSISYTIILKDYVYFFEGAQVLALYIMISVFFFFLHPHMAKKCHKAL